MVLSSLTEPFSPSTGDSYGIFRFYLGFAVLDNYYEIFGLKIRASFKKIQSHAYLTLYIGILLTLFMYVPIIGGLVGTIIATIIGVLALNDVEEAKKKFNLATIVE